MSKENIYSYRYVAQIVLQADTALKVGSGESDLFIDSPVLKDWNGLPMILGTSIAGVLRSAFRMENSALENDIFGNDNGSRLLVSNAHLVDECGRVHQGLGGLPQSKEFLDRYKNLPVREHTAINERGVALEKSKFDEEVVYAGSRFKCELELIGTKEDEELWQTLLSLLVSPLFRLGGGGTKGFGDMKIVSCHQQTYIIGTNYAEKPSDLNTVKGKDKKPKTDTNETVVYKIKIKPDNFFSFGSGFGDDEVDDIAVKEHKITWDSGKGVFGDMMILMPASSLKGALSHRVAFHYNRLNGVYADEIEFDDFKKHIGSNNYAVATLFGVKKGDTLENSEDEGPLIGKGKALFSDLYKEDKKQEKIFDHVKIDRFTGGAIDSALYDEKVIAQRDEWVIEIVLADDINGKTREAFEATLDDLCTGMLPLGGKVNRGHGVFLGVEGFGEKGWKKEGGNDVKK